ncbi:hypothetical protein [Hoeflea alexandrii]|uniref:AP2 domain-containing protein n=1 Tax=Hoeflea alexandrii TaxID=288436 RepID=A0ABT1CMD0_9HYPH|nr:hypothetical protein [Hoeflea alexandrii]MCO6407335.1 hypothetical protein [Hoeflea alexandrii]MCY0154268.1 hypothetical protein [Hoeflea alexandrii]
MSGKPHDLTGQSFGNWIVLEFAGAEPPKHKAKWFCQCVCGARKVVPADSLKRGKSKSCGCLTNTMRIKSCQRHGHTSIGFQSRTYSTWHAMKERCQNERHMSYPDYGGRGISVCDRWNDFANFLADMGEKPDNVSIDRIDVNGNYEPSNCRWANVATQSANKRKRVKYQDIYALIAAASAVCKSPRSQTEVNRLSDALKALEASHGI